MGVFLRGMRGDIGPLSAMFWRSSIGFWIILCHALISRRPVIGQASLRWKLLIRSAAGGFSLMCLFIAIDRIDLGTATALCYSYPLFATLLSWRYLGERAGWVGMSAIVLAWCGIAVMVTFRPAIGLGEGAGLLSGLLAGVAIHTLRDIRAAGESTTAVLTFFLAFSSLIALPGAIMEDPTLGLATAPWWGIMGLAVFATVGQLFLTVAYRYLPTRSASPTSLLVVPLSAFGAFLFYGEVPPPGSLAGGAMLLAGLFLLTATARIRMPPR